MHYLSTLIKTIADDMKGYDNIRAGGNIGTAINGFLIKEGLEKLSNSIDNLADVLSKKENKIEINPVIDLTNKKK